MKIDAHHHLWRYTPEEYAWIDDSMACIRRDFLANDLVDLVSDTGIDGAVTVQARQTLEETRWLLAIADATPQIKGVVGWVDLCSSSCQQQIEEFKDDRKLVGMRHVVQGEPDGFLLRGDFNRGVDMLDAYGLAYDLLINEQQLTETIRFADRHAGQRLILDHIAKPKIATGETEPWAKNIRELSRRPHVTCKISGLVTEAEWGNWSLETLRPYLDTVLEAFGPARLMAGSDWPVCLVASSYERWWSLLHRYCATLSTHEQAAIFGGTAIETYLLEIK